MASSNSAPRLPKGYKDKDAFLLDARKLYQMDIDSDRMNRYQALDDLKFACNYNAGQVGIGAQWDQAVVQQRRGRPCLVNNVLPQYIGQIVGDNRINRPAIKVRPAEDADEELAEIRAGIIRWIEAQSNAQWIYTTALQSLATCGIGHFRCGLDYSDNDTFLRDLRIKPISDPLSVVWDCMSVERTGKDAKRCFVTDEMPKTEFEQRWPDATPGDWSFADNDLMTNQWVTRDTVRVCEYWRMEEEKRTLALFPDGSIEDITGKKDFKSPKGAIKETREVAKAKAMMWLITGWDVLEGPFEVPIDRIPIFRCFGQVYQAGNDRVWFGLVRFMKDMQRLQNYADSVIAESLATAPKQQWLADTIAVEGREQQIRTAHINGDPLMVKNTGGEMIRLDPAPMPTGMFQWRQLLTQQMKDVSGLHDASLGIQSNETSGKAIMARQREGDVATIVYHDNLNAAIAECGRVLNELIPVVYDTKRQIRIVGKDEAMQVIKINDPEDDEAKDMSQGKFDIVVETGPSYSTKRVEAAESMIQFVQAFPQAAAVAGDLIAQAQDWPDADTFAERLQALLPPELQKGKAPEDMSPEEQMQFMQQQQVEQQQAEEQKQIVAQGLQLEMREKEATVSKLEAEAERARADAMKAAREAEQGTGEQVNPVIQLAEVRKATAEAQAAEANALKAAAQAREAEAKALLAEQQAGMAQTERAFNELDAVHKIEHGRGITDPEEPAEGAEEAA